MRRFPPDSAIHTCTACGRPFVVPERIIAVLPASEGYLMRLACTNCGHWVVGVFDEDTMTDLDIALTRDQEDIVGDLLAVG